MSLTMICQRKLTSISIGKSIDIFEINLNLIIYYFSSFIYSIGRTGRVGNRGKATSFYDQSQDNEVVSELTRILKQANQIVPEFFSGGSGACGGVDQFGGADIRQPAAAAQEESEW